MKQTLLIILLIFGGTVMARAQTTDTLRAIVDPVEVLYQWLLEGHTQGDGDDAATEGVTEEGYEDLIEDFLYYQEHPININSGEAVHLEEMGLLNAFQVDALGQYRKQFGDLLFPEELMMIEGFSETVVAVITPLVHFGKSEITKEHEKITPGKAVRQGRHRVTLNYARKWNGTDNEDYLGSPDKLQLKYAYHYQQKLRFGVALEKDAGEPFRYGFGGAHFFMTDLKVGGTTVKSLALGDYQLGFGQGLTLWSGISFGKASGGSSPMKRAAGVKPKASAGEGKFFRGAATTLKYKDFYATGFYSNRRIDSTTTETGYHRTESEIARRNAIRQQVFGGHLCYAGPHLELGYTLYHLRLSAPIELKPSNYNQFYFQDDRLTCMGLDFRWVVGKAAFFGELSRSGNGAFAGLVGATVKPTGYVNFSVLYRNYDKRYQTLFTGAFGESSRKQGEEGVYLGLQCAPSAGWDLIAYADFFRLTWLGSQVYNPSWGQEYSLKIVHQINKTTTMQLRFKAKTKMKNSSDASVFSHYPIFYTRRSLNFQINYAVTDALTFSDKASYAHYLNDDGAQSRGYLVCHDIVFQPVGQPYSLTFRYALFDSDDYYSRVSVYENDVLGAFSIPSLSGLGSRAYLLGKLKLFGCLSLYSRIGCSLLSEETKIDFKAEIVGKF